MPIRGEKWFIERADRMHDAIVRAIVRFEHRYTPSTPENNLWAREVVKRVHAWCDHMRGNPGARRPIRDINAPVLLDVDDIERERATQEATRQELTSEQLDEKRAQWRRMWARIGGSIIAFQREQLQAAGDDRELADGIMDQISIIVARHRIDLEREHPGMPSIDDITPEEMVHALLFDDLDDDDEDNDDSDDDEAASEERPSS